ncbi:UDP-glycosyltransferase 86A1 [Magnolia sinica]|uniref:UDP-glycosyltransferase 86A1 n=1 Tax=Magnolia sinica TaxID=86752 RepID=UPI002659709A|nr:UDP-glycosyltransferase 86A1 [Magnolia sinica]
MADTKHKLHALFIPYPLQGHLIPAVHLAIKLASKGFTITFVNTQAIHHQISKAKSSSGSSNDNNDIFAHARQSGLDIRYMTVSDGLPVEFNRSLNHDQFMATLLHILSAHIDDLIRKITQEGPPIACMIADTFFVWPSTIAKKYGLINVSLWTEPALVFTLYYHMHLLRRHGHFACNDNREDIIDYIPGVAAIDPADLPSYLQDADISTVVHQIIFKAFAEAKDADYILCNTVYELEPETISALHIKKPFYAIGPTFPFNSSKSIVAMSLWPESDCTKWLDSKPAGSVLYISFGSYAPVRKKDLEEIAMGVLHSQVNFIWVLRPYIMSSDAEDPLPVGFMEECRERGIIVPWCCQMAVLSHPSVGGFLTHCGWNSILESVWCGVPMLCYPLLTDQFTNHKLVVDDWKIGIDIRRCNRSVTRNEVSAKIKALMATELGDDLRKEIKEVRRALENTLKPNGSSEKNIDLFIEDLKNKVCAQYGTATSTSSSFNTKPH